MIGIRINDERIGELMKKAEVLEQTAEVSLVGARGAANFVQDYLFDLDATRTNKMGGLRTHFFANAARSVSTPQPVGAGAAFSINQVGFAQRLRGGIIRPGVGVSSATGEMTKFLAIPARAESYGKTPGEFHDLVFQPTRTGGMLVQGLQTVITRGNRKGDYSTTPIGGLVMYWLVKEVNQTADPTILPSDIALAGAAGDSMESYLSRRIN